MGRVPSVLAPVSKISGMGEKIQSMTAPATFGADCFASERNEAAVSMLTGMRVSPFESTAGSSPLVSAGVLSLSSSFRR